MTEAYLTMTDLAEIRNLMHLLNSQYKTGGYTLEVQVKDRSKNTPIGVVKQISKGSEFVFVPATGYAPYAPTDRGE